MTLTDHGQAGAITMTTERPPAALAPFEALRLFERMCEGKAKFSRGGAGKVAEAMRAAGMAVAPYPCCFCHCWHTGHAPSMETVEMVARYIRFGVA